MRKAMKHRIIKLKSQSKWIVRFFTLTGIILGFLFAFTSHPIGGTNAENIECPEGQHTEDGEICVDDEQQMPCLQTGEIPANSNYNVVNITGIWNSGTNSWDIPACGWECNTHYHKSGNACEIDTFSVSCEDRFIDSGYNKKVKLGNCGANKTYQYGTIARGSDWGTSTGQSTGGPYYSYYRYNSGSSTTVNETGTVYRYFKGYTNIMLIDPKGIEHWQDTELGTFDVSYNGGAYYTNVTNEPSEFLASGESIKIKNIQLNEGYTLKDVIYSDYRSSCSGNPLNLVSGVYDFSIMKGGGNICIRTTYINYTITYNLNGGINNANNPSSYSMGSETITLQAPSRVGYTFVGWTGSNGNVPEKVVQIPANSTGDRVYYAVWEITSYTLTINPNGGIYNGTSCNTTVTQDYLTDYTMMYPTKTGYIFAGWQGDTAVDWTRLTGPSVYNNNYNGAVTHSWIDDDTSPTNSKILKIVTDGTVSPSAGGFIQSILSQTGHVYYQVYRAKVPTGYSIQWTSNPIGNGSSNRALTSMYGNGEWTTYVFRTKAGSIGPFSTFGHIFINGTDNTNITWYVASAQIYDATEGVVKADFQNKYNFTTATDQTVTATWTPNVYYIAYDKNGGVGSMTNTTCTYDTNCALSSNTFTRAGYIFRGWSASSGATTATYTDGQDISNLTGTLGDTVTLYAVWNIIPEISFTGTTPADNAAQNENYFTSQVDITTSNLSGFSSVLDGNEISLYDDSLVLMYNFDNVESLGESETIVKDLSRNGYDGVVYGATWTGDGVHGGAYSFDGIDDYIEFPDYGPLDQSGTLSLWFYGDYKVDGILFGNYNGLAIGFYYERILGVTKPQHNHLGQITGYKESSWNHIVVTIDSGLINYYLNGVKLSNIISSNYRSRGTGNGTIGKRNAGSSPLFSGQIDEIRVYNRALSDEEINTLYHSNLSKTALNKRTYTIGFTGLVGGTHTYGGIMSDTLGSTGISRTINICGAGYHTEDGQTCKKSNVQVTFVANPSTFSDGRFSGGDTSKTLEYFFVTGGYYAAVTEEIQIPQKPHEVDLSGNLLTGWMFEGWYLDTGYSAASRWTGLSVNTTYTGITLYARYLPFKDKTVTMDGVIFTIMDRNMGALDYSSGYSFGSSNEQSNNDRKGLYYQRGNNFGFPNTGTLENTVSGVLIENFTNKEWGPGNYYFNGSFVLRLEEPYAWNSGTIAYENLWGGGGTNYSNSANHPDTDKQGPCPEGYHVPDTRERKATKDVVVNRSLTQGSYYCSSIDSIKTDSICMPAALGLPFAGDRMYQSAGMIRHGLAGFYWSSTAYIASNAYRLYFFWDGVTPQYGVYNTNGHSVRCFKNTTGVTLSYDTKGGTTVASSTERRWFAKDTAPINPTRAHSTFAGWYKDTGYTNEFIFSGDTYISEDTTLYAKWNCKAGYEMDENGDCKKSNVQVTFVANPTTFSDGRFSGETTSKTLEYFFVTGGYYAAKTEEIQIPQKPHEYDLNGNLLTGWMFEGRYLDTGYSAASRWTGLSVNTTYTGITLYARYLPFKDKTVTRDGVTFTIMDRNMGALDYSSGYSVDNEQSNNNRKGLYYQRGNNFGFPTGILENTLSGVLIENFTNKSRGPGNYYFNGSFVKRSQEPYYWNSGATANDNLWGGNSISNPDIDRQGPCPEGYHVPYATERKATKNLFDKRAVTDAGSIYCNSIHSTNTGVQYCIPAILGLPHVGYRGRIAADSTNVGYSVYLSSTKRSINSAYNLLFTVKEYSDSADYTSYGFSIRCFKDTTGVTLSYDTKGGTAVASSIKRRWFAKSTAPTKPTRANSTFAGWFKDTGYSEQFIFSGDTYISEDTTLYAKWTCNQGYIESLDGQSCEENILPYTVNHYQQNTGNNGYTLFETENKTGLSDHITQAAAKVYTGFTAQDFEQETIQGNDTHVDIYYDRDIYTININLNGGTGTASFTGKYGDPVVPPEITRSGYSIKKRVPELPETMPIDGFSSKPVRVLTDGLVSISVNPEKNTLDLSINGTSNSSRELTGTFTSDYFIISDTKGEETGYHATLSIGDLVGNNNENHIIPASNVQVKTDGIVSLSGVPSSEVGLSTTMTNWKTATGQVTYFTRGDIVIDDECKPGEYGINLDLKITVPSHTIPDDYHGTITYTLYED